MTIREGIINDALRRASPQDLDDVLTAIEAYRMCAGAAARLDRRALGSQRNQVRECAERIESLLEEFAATGVLASLCGREGKGRALVFVGSRRTTATFDGQS
jgi:hypothetical protein